MCYSIALVLVGTLIVTVIPRDMFGFLLLPLFTRALDSGDVKTQEEALKKLNTLSDNVDFDPLKDQVLPLVHALALKTVSGKVRINSLVLMGALVERLDKEEANKMLNTTAQVDTLCCDHMLSWVMCWWTRRSFFVLLLVLLLSFLIFLECL